MSMDLFLTCVRDGANSTFTRELFEEVMGRGAVNPQSPLTDVRYADGGCNDIDGAEDAKIETVTFSHFGGGTFFDRLWELADRSGSYILWPDEGPSLAVTRRELIAKLDPEMAKELGPPVVVRSGKELAAAIESGADDEDDDDDDFDE